MSDRLFDRLSKDNKYLNLLNEFDKEIDNNSDRGLVLICGSILDVILEDLLKSFLITKSKIDKDMFTFGRPLGNFDAKIVTSFYLGLITDNERSNLSFIRGLRNRFAHDIFDVSFNNNDIENICSNFYIPKDAYVPTKLPLMKEGSEEQSSVDLNPIKEKTSAKDRFIVTFRYLYMNLVNRTFYEDLCKREEFTKVYKAHESAELSQRKLKESFEVMVKQVKKIKVLSLKELELLKDKNQINSSNYDNRKRKIYEEYDSQMKDIDKQKEEYKPLIDLNDYFIKVLENSMDK